MYSRPSMMLSYQPSSGPSWASVGAGESRAKPRHEGGGGARRSCRSEHSLGSRRSFHLCPRGRLLLPVTLRLLEVAA
jgi:hypothetical protein